jgi:hypothetical protein
MKLTNGLHQALRHHDDDLGVARHGIVNLAVAAALASQGESTPTLRDVIHEENAAAFVLTAAAIGWQDLAVTAPAVQRSRRESLVAIGSCSITKPHAALSALGLI